MPPWDTTSLRLPPTRDSHHSSARPSLCCHRLLRSRARTLTLTYSAYRVTRVARLITPRSPCSRIGEDEFALLSYLVLYHPFHLTSPGTETAVVRTNNLCQASRQWFIALRDPRAAISKCPVSEIRLCKSPRLAVTGFPGGRLEPEACPSWFHPSSAYSGNSSSPSSHPLSPRSPILISLLYIVSHADLPTANP